MTVVTATVVTIRVVTFSHWVCRFRWVGAVRVKAAPLRGSSTPAAIVETAPLCGSGTPAAIVGAALLPRRILQTKPIATAKSKPFAAGVPLPHGLQTLQWLPTQQISAQPSTQASTQPSTQLSTHPSTQLSTQLSTQPSIQPSIQPLSARCW